MSSTPLCTSPDVTTLFLYLLVHCAPLEMVHHLHFVTVLISYFPLFVAFQFVDYCTLGDFAIVFAPMGYVQVYSSRFFAGPCTLG